jgi:hypothetical protein
MKTKTMKILKFILYILIFIPNLPFVFILMFIELFKLLKQGRELLEFEDIELQKEFVLYMVKIYPLHFQIFVAIMFYLTIITKYFLN